MNNVSKLKYSGKLVDEGIIDARLAAGVIAEIDELLRLYMYLEVPALSKQEIQIPVKINHGSWVVEVFELIVSNFGIGLNIAMTIGAGAYLKKLGEKSAEDGLLETGLSKDIQKVFIGAHRTLFWVIKIAKHLKGLNKKINYGKFSNNNHDVEILNDQGGKITVPRIQIQNYEATNKRAFHNIAKAIESERVFKYEFYDSAGISSIEIQEHEKCFFYSEDEEEMVLPELVHGNQVNITGRITRLNDKSGTLGFEYQNHILTLIPEKSKDIKQFKRELISDDENKIFPIVIIDGTVDRIDSNGDIKLKKPAIKFSKITKAEEIKPSTNQLSF